MKGEELAINLIKEHEGVFEGTGVDALTELNFIKSVIKNLLVSRAAFTNNEFDDEALYYVETRCNTTKFYKGNEKIKEINFQMVLEANAIITINGVGYMVVESEVDYYKDYLKIKLNQYDKRG